MDVVFISHLEIVDFRNISHIEMIPYHRFNIISGNNGAGKTNLIEAIYYLSALRSFRTVRRGEVVRHGSKTALLKALFSGAASGLLCECEIGKDFRRIKSGGKEVALSDGHFSSLPMVLFGPSNLSLVQGGPDERRRYMDRALFQADITYPSVVSGYTRALKNRNRLLKRSSINRRLLAPYDEQLASLGEKVVGMRRSFIERAAHRYEEALCRISRGLKGTLVYRPNIEGGKEEITATLECAFDTDMERGFTGRGPHADDLDIRVGGRMAKRFASQGQQRMAVLSLKMAETLVLQEVTGVIPILLLDDISSELDRERNRSLFDFLREICGQVFITTTHLDHVLISGQRNDFLLDNGLIVDTRMDP